MSCIPYEELERLLVGSAALGAEGEHQQDAISSQEDPIAEELEKPADEEEGEEGEEGHGEGGDPREQQHCRHETANIQDQF